MQRIIRAPSVSRSIALAGGPVNIVVPAGLVYEIYAFHPTTLVTAGQIWSCLVDGRVMEWCQANANFGPAWIYAAVEGWPNDLDRNRAHLEPIPIVAIEGQVITIQSGDNSGVITMSYRVKTLESGLRQTTDGGTDGKKRTIWSLTRQATNVGIGLTADIQMITNINPPGETVFPWAGNVPPQRRYFIHAVACGLTDVVGTNLDLDGIRLLHEGRELITPAGIVTRASLALEHQSTGLRLKFFKDPYEVNSFEQVQLFLRVTSTDANIQAATLEAGLLLTEEFLDGQSI